MNVDKVKKYFVLKSMGAVEINLLKPSDTIVLDSNVIDMTGNHDGKFRKMQEGSDRLQCPFYWREDLYIQSYGDHESDLLSEFEEMSEEPSFILRKFITHLIMCYHNFYKRLVENSLRNMDEMDRILCYSLREGSCDPLFFSIKDALLHVLLSCRVYILETTNRDGEARQILEKMKPHDSMDKANKAAIWAIRAAVYVEYGYAAVKRAVEYMNTAVQIDGENAFWLFFSGLYLGRLRRMEKAGGTPFPDMGILNLEKAIRKHEDPVFYSFAAETYLEMVESIEKNHDLYTHVEDSPMIMENWTKKAANYFKKSVDMTEGSAHLFFRCGQGLLRLHHPYQDLEKAEELLERGLKLSPNSSYGNHEMATFIMNYKKDSEAAVPYLEKSIERNNFRAHIDLCRKRLLEDENSVMLELKKLLDVYKEVPKMCKIYGELICCRLFLHYNLLEACEYAKKLIDTQTSWINYDQEFESSVFPFSRRVPLIELLVAEIRNELPRESTAEVEKNAYKTFIHYILDEEIDVSESSKEGLLSRYVKDMEKGLRKRRQFLALKLNAEKNKDNGTEEKHRDTSRNSRGSNDREYRKYYIAEKNRSAHDILHPISGEGEERVDDATALSVKK